MYKLEKCGWSNLKGDNKVMNEVVQKDEVIKLNRYGTIYTILLIVTMVSAVPLFMWLGTIAFVPWGIVFATSLYFALKIEIIKKNNDIQTYREIVAFSEGKKIDEMQKQKEINKRPYEKVLIVIGSALLVAGVCVLLGFLMHVYLN